MRAPAAARRPRWPVARTALASIAGAVLGVMVGGHVDASVGPFDASLSARPSFSGHTVLRLAPLGTIRLDTHDAPVVIDARVDELRVEEAEAIARDPLVLGRLEEELADDARGALLALLWRSVLAALLGGLVGTLVGSRRLRPVAVGLGTAVVLVGGTVAQTARTWDPQALAEPRYTGLLTVAPRAIGDVEAIVDRFGEYRAQLADLIGNLTSLYAAGRVLPTADLERAGTRLLHVSDVHLNPQAFDLMKEVVRQFDIQAVVDSGDTTDWGSEPESALLDGIGKLGVPYVWVRGNHDSERTAAAVAAQPNAMVLDSSVAEVAGLRIWGFADRRYTPDKSKATGRDVERAEAAAVAPRAAAALGSVTPAPDIALVHDARMAAELGNLVPLVLAGHTHEPRQARIGAATLLVEGSTGGGGLRGLQGTHPEPLTATVLHFDPGTRTLVAYDRITVEGLGQTGARIVRHLLRGPDRATTTTSVPSPSAPAATAGPRVRDAVLPATTIP